MSRKSIKAFQHAEDCFACDSCSVEETTEGGTPPISWSTLIRNDLKRPPHMQMVFMHFCESCTRSIVDFATSPAGNPPTPHTPCPPP